MAPKGEPKADNTVSVDITDFTRTRDNILLCFSQVAKAVGDLQQAYINHTNTVLHYDPPAHLNFANLQELGLLPGRDRAASPGAKSEAGGDGKRKRKRRAPDPNAPKRALTPFFLYMQHNRKHIAQELGANAKPKAVSEEGTARWAEMPEDKKQRWKELYARNLEVYKKKVEAYKAGLPFADDEGEQAANQLQQDVEGASPSDHDEEEEEEEGSESEEEEEEPAKEPSPEPEPTPARSKRRRSEGKTAAAAASTPKNSSAKKASPEKKKKGAAAAVQAQEVETPGSGRKGSVKGSSKKKRKSEVE